MMNALHELTTGMTKVSGSKPLPFKDGFTVPFLKDCEEYFMHCYTSFDKMDLVLAAPYDIMESIIPWNFPVVGPGFLVFCKTPNLDDGYALQAKIITSLHKTETRTGKVFVSSFPAQYVYFTQLKMACSTLKDDYAVVQSPV